MGRPKLKSGERRIDAAIDHLAPYGFPKPQIRKVINDLLKLYGRDGWAFLEDGSYRVVLEKLLEEQTQLESDFKWTSFICRNKKQQLSRRHHQKMIWKYHEYIVMHRLNLGQPLNVKLLPTVHFPRIMYYQCLQLQELLVQGVPAMDGLAKSLKQKVNQRMAK
nr:unnamed protein product [Digitaria exilis]